jgi:diacylglycerol O-acyltransferase
VFGRALRRYLSDRDDLPDGSLVAMVPVSTHGSAAGDGTNRVSGMFTSLCTTVDDPGKRLLAIAAGNRSCGWPRSIRRCTTW